MNARLLMLLASLCSCTETGLSTVDQDLSKEQLEADGYTCTATSPHGGSYTCQKCISTTVTDSAGTHNITSCWYEQCNGSPGGGTDCTSQAIQGTGYWFEAEAAKIYGSLQKGVDGDASAGSYLSVAGSGSTRVQFTNLASESLTAWARVIAPSTAANSIYIQLDGQPVVQWELPVSTTWTWVPISATWSLAAGSHYLRLYGDELGVKIDRVLLTSNLGFVPVAQMMQAETASVVAPMQKATQRTFPSIGYIWIPNGAGSNGLAQLQVSVPYADEYIVWGRVNAPSAADNSFDVGKLGESRIAWDTPVSTSWAWDRVDVSGAPALFSLDDTDVLEFAQREDGIKLDKIVITNDPGMTLVEPAPPTNSL